MQMTPSTLFGLALPAAIFPHQKFVVVRTELYKTFINILSTCLLFNLYNLFVKE